MLRDVPQERDSLSDTPALKSGTNRAKGTAEQAPRRAAGRAGGRGAGSTAWADAPNWAQPVGGRRPRPVRGRGREARF